MSTMYTPLQLKLGTIHGVPDHYSRTYEIRSTEQNMDALMQSTMAGRNINATTIQQASGMIGMSSDASARLAVNGGWGETRQVIQLIVESNSTGSLYVLDGFTDAGFWTGNTINPRAMIRFNSFTELAPITNEMGQRRYRPVNRDFLLTSVQFTGGTDPRGIWARPRDVVTASITAGHSDLSLSATSLTPSSSRAQNNDAAMWLGLTVNELVTAGTTPTLGESGGLVAGQGPEVLCNHAASSQVLQENQPVQMAFLGYILDNHHDLRNGGVSWATLVQKLPALVNMVRPPEDAGGGDRIQLSSWNNRDSAIIISEFGVGMAGIMKELTVAGVTFTVTNQGHQGGYAQVGNQPQMRFNGDPNKAIGFAAPGVDGDWTVRSFCDRVTQLFAKVAKGHQMTISCDASAMTTMTVRVQWNGMDFSYTAGTFAASMWAATTATELSSNSLAGSVYKMADYLSKSIGNDGQGGAQSAMGTHAPAAGGMGANTDWFN